jgi:hypothetical protein
MIKMSEAERSDLRSPESEIDDLVERARGLGQDSAPEALLSWGGRLAGHQHQAVLMAALFDAIGPEVTARLLRLTTFAADRSQSYATEMAETLTAFKTALSAGSTRLSDPEGFADELGRWLLPTELADHEHAHLAANGGLPFSGPAALAQILRDTSFAPGFLTGLAGRVEHFEQSGKVDPQEYYRQMTPSRFDGYQARDIAGLLGDQRRTT